MRTTAVQYVSTLLLGATSERRRRGRNEETRQRRSRIRGRDAAETEAAMNEKPAEFRAKSNERERMNKPELTCAHL